jgi:hypothetical protein
LAVIPGFHIGGVGALSCIDTVVQPARPPSGVPEALEILRIEQPRRVRLGEEVECFSPGVPVDGISPGTKWFEG